MARILLAIGGTIFLVLGTLHGVLTLRDVATPRAFTPTDKAVRIAMQGARLAFNPRVTASHLLQGIAVVVAATYLVLSLCFWFWGPALGSGISLLCILAAIVLS